MKKLLGITLLSLLTTVCAFSAEEPAAPTATETPEEEYIPSDLEDAVRVLSENVPASAQAKIRSGEIEVVSMHHGLGRGLRNRWGLWGGSRLAQYFENRGVGGADDMSGYILEAFCRHLRGEDFDLLQMMRARDEAWRSYRVAVMDGDEMAEDRSQAILFSRLDYDKEKRVVWTALLWNPDDGMTYFIDHGADSRIASKEDIANLKGDAEHWLFSDSEQELLRELFKLSEDERLVEIKSLSEDQRWKIDGILPRTKEPDGIDKVDDPFDDPFADAAKAEQDAADQDPARWESKDE